jgi:hypothetical protein
MFNDKKSNTSFSQFLNFFIFFLISSIFIHFALSFSKNPLFLIISISFLLFNIFLVKLFEKLKYFDNDGSYLTGKNNITPLYSS